MVCATEVRYDDLIGKPFSKNGRGPDSYDCYGLVHEMFKRYGRETPDYLIASHEGMANMARIALGIREWKKTESRPGVMVLFRLTQTLHVGFLLPFGRMIHTWERSGGVCVERFDAWKQKAIGYYEY